MQVTLFCKMGMKCLHLRKALKWERITMYETRFSHFQLAGTFNAMSDNLVYFWVTVW